MSREVRGFACNERGQVVVFFAFFLPVLFGLGAIVIAIGNWYTHARHLQTKADAGALAGGSVWGFPCGTDADTTIENEARRYVGQHMKADGTPSAATTFNPQVGGVGASKIHVVLNGSTWYDDDSNPFPQERNDPPSSATSLCESMTLDVKVTEDNSFPLFSLLPLYPDIKRKARVQIEEIEGLSGLLPIAVRAPRPQAVAAVFYNEANGNVLAVKYFREVCTLASPGCLMGAPPGVGQWTTLDSSGGNWASVSLGGTTGVVIATSFRPACGAPGASAPCMNDTGFGATVNDFCRHASGTVQCYDATGTGASQNVRSGLHFIRGFQSTDAGTGPPQLHSAHLDDAPAGCGSYFSAATTNCSARLTLGVNVGALVGEYTVPPPPPNQTVTAPLRASDVEVRYRLLRSDGTVGCNYGVNCDLIGSGSGPNITFSTQGNGSSPHLAVTPDSGGNAVAIQIRLRNAQNHPNVNCRGDNFNNNCRWYYTAASVSPDVPPTDTAIRGAPIQRSFAGNIDLSGPVKWLRLGADTNCDGTPEAIDGEAGSQPTGTRCFFVDLGLQGGLAREQDEPPIPLNLSSTSQRSVLDCDPSIPNLKDEILRGCGPFYASNRFNTSPFCPNASGVNQFFSVPKAPPFDDWPPYRCVITQTSANPDQVTQGLNERLFGVSNNPVCPPETSLFVPGRNYWHDLNNSYVDSQTGETDVYTFARSSRGHSNLLRDDDPRLVTLFFTPYDSFTGSGNAVYPIVGFGSFYITGYGRFTGQGLQIEDPCSQGNNGDLFDGSGNEPPPDLPPGNNTTFVWGHYVKSVTPTGASTPSGRLCVSTSFMPCIPVLVE